MVSFKEYSRLWWQHIEQDNAEAAPHPRLGSMYAGRGIQ